MDLNIPLVRMYTVDETWKKCLFFKRRIQHILFTVIWPMTYIKDHSHSKRGNTISIKGSLIFIFTINIYLYKPFLRQDSTYYGLCYTSRGRLLQREIAESLQHEGLIGRPMSPWAGSLPRSYISLPLIVNTSTPWLFGLKTSTTHEVHIDLLIIGYWSLLLLERDVVPG